MDTVIQIAAAFGPVALAIMGVVVSLNPPNKIGRTHKVWAASFVAVGIVAALSIFFEFRGTDQILGQIWERIQESRASTPAKEGARLFLEALGFAKGADEITVKAINRGDSVARAGIGVGSYYAVTTRILSDSEEDDLYRGALIQLSTSGSGVEVLPQNFRTALVPIKLTDQQWNDLISGSAHFYIVSVMSFTDELTPTGHRLLASMCNHFSKRTDVGSVCLTHNESRQLN